MARAGKPGSTEIFSTFDDFLAIHVASHPANATEIVWLDASGEVD